MNTNNVKFGLMLSVLMLTAVGCGDDDKKVDLGYYNGSNYGNSTRGTDESNNCTQGYIDSFNAVVTSAQEIMGYYDSNQNLRDTSDAGLMAFLESVKKMDRKCDTFLGSYRGVNCRAVSLRTGTTGYTNATQMESGCAKIKDALNSINGNNQQTAQISSAVLENIGADNISTFPIDIQDDTTDQDISDAM